MEWGARRSRGWCLAMRAEAGDEQRSRRRQHRHQLAARPFAGRSRGVGEASFGRPGASWWVCGRRARSQVGEPTYNSAIGGH